MRVVTLLHVILIFSIFSPFGTAFEFPNIFQIPTFVSTTASKVNPVQEIKGQLVQAVSNTANGKNASPETQQKVLEIVNRLERTAPPSPNLLLDAEEAKILDGVWFLQYTSPSIVGDADQFPNAWKPDYSKDDIPDNQKVSFQAKGSVAASVITVETSNRVVKQCFDIATSTVTNDIALDFGRVCVSGTFRASSSVRNRAIVAFEKCLIILNNGITIDLGFLFTLLAFVRRTKDSGWLETTFVDSELRIGRGNKGTMFVLTRDLDAVKP